MTICNSYSIRTVLIILIGIVGAITDFLEGLQHYAVPFCKTDNISSISLGVLG